MATYPQMKGRYGKEDLEKIIGKAQALYGREKETLGRAELDSTAEELDIPGEYIERAIAELKEENAIKEKSRKTMRVALGLGEAPVSAFRKKGRPPSGGLCRWSS